MYSSTCATGAIDSDGASCVFPYTRSNVSVSNQEVLLFCLQLIARHVVNGLIATELSQQLASHAGKRTSPTAGNTVAKKNMVSLENDSHSGQHGCKE